MQEQNSFNPNTPPKLTRRGKIAAGIAGIGLTTGAFMGVNALSDSTNNTPVQPENITEQPIFYADHDTKDVKVRPGDGVDDVVQRAYGIDAPEGVNQVVQNNPEYTAEYAAVVDANQGSEELQPGKLPLPVDFYTQEEVDKMQSSQ